MINLICRYLRKSPLFQYSSKDSVCDYVRRGKNWLSLNNLFTISHIVASLRYIILLHHCGGKQKKLELGKLELKTPECCTGAGCRGRSCSWSGRLCEASGTVFLVTTPSITRWTLWSRACPASWTDYTLWTANADKKEGYTKHAHSQPRGRHLVNNESPTRVIWLFTVRDCSTPPGGI